MRIIYKCLNVYPFEYTDFEVSGKVGYPSTGLTTPITWMVSVTSAIDRPKSMPQLPHNQM